MLKKKIKTDTLNKPETDAAALYPNRKRLDLPKVKILFCFFEVFLLRATQKQQTTCNGVIFLNFKDCVSAFLFSSQWEVAKSTSYWNANTIFLEKSCLGGNFVYQ